MANELIINASLPETRIALMEDGEIQELLIERASGKGIVGNIYKGRVTRVLPGMQAAFVDIGLEKAAFLYVDDVYVHSEIWEEEEETNQAAIVLAEVHASEVERAVDPAADPGVPPRIGTKVQSPVNAAEVAQDGAPSGVIVNSVKTGEGPTPDPEEASDWEEEVSELSDDEDDESDDDEPNRPAEMGPGPDDASGNEGSSSEQPSGTVAPEAQASPTEASDPAPQGEGEEGEDKEGSGQGPGRRRHRRGRRGGRFRRRGPGTEAVQGATQPPAQQKYPETYHDQVADSGTLDSDRSGLAEEQRAQTEASADNSEVNRPENAPREANSERRPSGTAQENRPEFRAQRSRDRRIRQKTSSRPVKSQVNIQDLLKEGQEVLVQVAKDPIATKGARLTCHISLPGRHLVCMPTIDHVGVSRRIERDDERRRLREYVERNRPRNLGFIVRTASGKQQSEKRIKQDIEYLTRLWTEIREKAGSVTAPALVYEDLNSVLRAIRDWVTEEIDKVIVDSRYHYNEIQRFVSHFMPSLKQKVELYHGDIPIFDAYGISTELSRALERKVWLKSGGYIVIDQAEALVAIDVNTGRYVGKKNLEDTILKTNLEAVQEIAYQLRLRNCGGIIILDLIDMEKDENKHRVYRALEEALSRDRARPTILKISELGLVEMTRKRTRDTIVRTLCESCTHCEGKGFIKGKQTVAYEVMREIEREGIEREVSKILVQANPEVIDILAIDERETLDQLERRYRKQIYLQAVTDFHPEQFEVTADKRERSEKSERGRDFQGRDHQNDRSHDSGHDRNRHRETRENRENRENRDGRERHRNENPAPAHAAPESTGPQIAKLGIVVSDAAQAAAPASSADAPQVEKPTGSIVITPPASPIPPANSTNANGSDFDEEDRLAFLRAQAAQDAALARLGSGNAGSPTTRNSGDQAGRGDRGAGGPRSGRRPPRRGSNGKFRRGADRTRDRAPGPGGPKPFGYSQNVKRSEPVAKDAVTPPADPPAGSGGSSGGEGPVGGSGGPGSDHSQPPV